MSATSVGFFVVSGQCLKSKLKKMVIGPRVGSETSESRRVQTGSAEVVKNGVRINTVCV